MQIKNIPLSLAYIRQCRSVSTSSMLFILIAGETCLSLYFYDSHATFSLLFAHHTMMNDVSEIIEWIYDLDESCKRLMLV
jgi:ribonucleotide reductase beta subunit family protein with ferritin-like domain